MNKNDLFEAVYNGSLQKVKDAVNQGVDIHANEDWALCCAASDGYIDILQYLIGRGGNIHTRDEWPLRWAAGMGHLNIVKYLVAQGADASILNYESQRIAEERGYQDIVDFLIKEMSLNPQTQKDLKGLNTDGRITCAKCGNKLNIPIGLGNNYNYCPTCEG